MELFRKACETVLRMFRRLLVGGFAGMALPAVAQFFVFKRSALPPPDPVQFLAVQRSSALISASSSRKAYPVRVLIYGQSISQQKWAWDTLKNLGKWHPGVAFIGEMRAISAFSSDYLLQTAEADIYPYRPDIIVFHAYGPYGEGNGWEQILRQFRSRTTADIILFGNHPRVDGELNEVTDPASIVGLGENWVNYVFAPRLAAELGLCFPDNRTAFKRYLTTVGSPVKTILNDTIHFNELGSEIQMAILKSFIGAPRLFPPVDPFNNGRVQTHRIGSDGLRWENGRLRLSFVGNRLDAILTAGAPGGCRVEVDGQAPTSLPSGMGHRRTSFWKGDNGFRPAILRIGFTTKPLLERWVLTVTGENSDNPNDFEFEVSGSLTGWDGSGRSTNVFVSNSGRVLIGPDNWNFVRRPAGQIGTQILWESEQRSVDRLGEVPGSASWLEAAVTVINDFSDAAHVVELIADDPLHPPPVSALRVYHPGGPMAGSETAPGTAPTLRGLATDPAPMVVWPRSAPNWHLSGRSSLMDPWVAVSAAPVRRFDFNVQQLTGGGPMEFLRLDSE